jgi:hypothetical protein
MTTQKGKIISVIALIGILLIGYGIFVYSFVFPKNGNSASSNQNTVSQNPNPSKIRIDLQSGNITTDKKMLIVLKLSGFETPDSTAEMQKEGNIEIEINGKSTAVQNIEAIGETTLVIKAQTEITDDKFNDFNNGKNQILDLRIDFIYDRNNTATKVLSTSFKKNDKTPSSSGQEIAFGNVASETPGNNNSKPVISNSIRRVTVEPANKPIGNRIGKTPANTNLQRTAVKEVNGNYPLTTTANKYSSNTAVNRSSSNFNVANVINSVKKVIIE